MNRKPGGNKSFQWRQASMVYTSVPLTSAELFFPTTEGEAARNFPHFPIDKFNEDNSKKKRLKKKTDTSLDHLLLDVWKSTTKSSLINK